MSMEVKNIRKGKILGFLELTNIICNDHTTETDVKLFQDKDPTSNTEESDSLNKLKTVYREDAYYFFSRH